MTGAHRERQQNPFAADDVRTRLLAATVTTIAGRGYRSATVGEITGAALTPAPSFHHFFADKQAAAGAAYDHALDWLLGDLCPLQADSAWALSLCVSVERTLELLAPHPDLVSFCTREFPRSGVVGHARHQETIACLGSLLRRGRADCPWSARLPRITEQFAITGALSLLASRTAPDRGGDLRRLAPDLTYFLLAPYLGQAEAMRVARAPRPARAR